MVKRTKCENFSLTFRKIVNSKYNGKILENGNIRIGDDFALDSKTNMLYLIK